jgi:coproporphyrinogen III oxidase-like Fe-S oxidoreductase
MTTAVWRDELARRMALPQRHRLLQGYPMLPLLRPADPGAASGDLPARTRRADGSLRALDVATEEDAPPDAGAEPAWLTLDPTRPLIIGVLPHTQCNPRVPACGFCTFPHDTYNRANLQATTNGVASEVAFIREVHPELCRRQVTALYFGGATANLTPAASLRGLGDELGRSFDLRGAELTLEGVPACFRSLRAGPLEALLDMPAAHRRISMGVQTFDSRQLDRMGRRSFGGRRVVAAVVAKGHRLGLTVSADFLINLPGQSRTEILADLDTAARLGLDQICVYHLVLAKHLDNPWSRDPSLLAALPSTEVAHDNWLAAREALLARGYLQTTLTNFERADVHATERRFLYEEQSFSPDRFDALGFGPLSISTFVNPRERRAVKLARSKTATSFGGAWAAPDLYFPYQEEDVRLLYLTRTFARLAIDRAVYAALFGADVCAHFGEAIAALVDAGLLSLDQERIAMTPNGMFFADSITGLLAWPRTTELRALGAGQHTSDLLHEPLVLPYMG